MLEEVNRDAILIEYEWWDRMAPYFTFGVADTMLVFPPIVSVDLGGMRDDHHVRYQTALTANYFAWEVEYLEEILSLNSKLQDALLNRGGD